MKFAKYTFLFAGIYGIFALVPMYFFKNYVGEQNPPPISHPEFFYGFVGVALAWQFVFLIISKNPAKYRTLMLPSILEKAAWAIPTSILFMQGEVSASLFGAGFVDALLGILFAVAYFKTGRQD